MIQINEDILLGCKEGKPRMQRLLYEYCYRKWMALCRRYHNSDEDARSSLNLAFVKIIQNIDQVNYKELNFDAWARRIINNTLIDEYRKQKIQDEHYLKKESERELDFHAESSFNDGAENLNYQALLNLLNQLPDSPRIVFNMYVIDGYNHQEISERLDIPVGTSKWFLSIAKKLLKEKLEKITDKTTQYEVYRR